ncbi:MAG: undecaprenyl-phosphate glucose phosphotransferase [Pseudomonadota bacterium]
MTSIDVALETDRRSAYMDPVIFERLLKGADFVAVVGLSALLLVRFADAAGPGFLEFTALASIFLGFMMLLVLRELRAYVVRSWVKPILASLVGASSGAIVALCFWLLTTLTPHVVSQHWIVWFAISLLVYFALSRVMLSVWVKSFAPSDCFRQRVALVGGGAPAEAAINVLEKSAGSEVDIIGIFDDRNDERSPDSIRRHAKIGTVNDLADYARNNRVDLIIVTIPTTAETRLLQVLKALWQLPVDIRISGHTSKLRLTPRSYAYLGDLPLLSVFDRPLNGWSAFLKAMFDKVLAVCFIVGFAPVMAVVALAVKIESKGPAIFKQKRYGFNNELIWVYKFRSMYTDMSDANAARLVTKDDPRVTKVGKFIRKTSLDELPQFFNVLFGGLSLVGPRPHATQAKTGNDLYEDVLEGYFARHKVKPGITGLAQVNGWRGETDTVEKITNRVKYDLEYIDRWSILLDLKILLKTPITLLTKSENAY